MADQSASDLAAQIAAAYILAEQQLLAGATSIFARTAASTAGQLDAIASIRALASRIAHSLASQTPLIRAMVAAATNDGRRTASAQVTKALEGAKPSGSGGGIPPATRSGLALPDEPFDLSLRHGERAANAIRADLTSSLDDVRRRITRLPDDIYKAIAPHGAIYGVSPNEFTSAQAQATAWRVFVSQGVRGFTDKSGRDWSLSAYVEMAVRTASARAYNTSHLERLNALGVHYFTIPAHPGACPLCFPWQGALLCDDNTDDPAATTIGDAIAAGLFHPNAILGDQGVRPLGEVERGVKAWYSGPSVNLTTARGHHLTVSPNHPVLTPNGWVAAKLLRKGMQVFSAPSGERSGAVAVSDVNLDEPESTFEDELDALAARGGRTLVPASAHDLHGDGRSIQGEIEVVVPDRGLLAEIEAAVRKQSSELTFPRPDVQSEPGSRASSLLLGGLGVDGPVAGSLSDFHAYRSETPGDRRVANAESLADVLGGLAAGVEADDLVDVQWDHFEGHAYDLQTSTAAYVAGSILVHNCEHTLIPVFPGVTELHPVGEWNDAHAALFATTQKQRRLELEVRKAKRRLEYAYDPESRQIAKKDVVAAQQRVREFVNATPGLHRQPRREQVDLRDERIKLPTPIR